MAPVHKTSEDAIDKPDRRRRAPPHIILHTLPAFSFSTPTHSIRIQFAYQTPPARANPARTKMTTAVAGNVFAPAGDRRSTDTFGPPTFTAKEINDGVFELKQAMKYNTEAIEVLEPAVSAAVASIRKLPKRVHREGLSVKKHTDRKVAGLALQITETEDRMTTLIAGVDDRMDLMEDRMGKMEDRMGKMEDRMEKIEDRMEKMEDRMEKMEDRMGKMEVRMKNVEESLNNKLDTTTFLENMNAITAMLGELGSPSARARGMLSLTTLPRLRTEVTPNPGLLSPDALLSPHRSPTTSDPPSPSSPSASRPLRRKKSFIEKAVNFITRRVTANVSANYQPPPGFEDQLARELNEAITFVEVHGPPEPDTEALPPVPPLPASVSRDNLVVGSRRGPQSPTTAKGKGKGKEHER